MVHVSNRRLAKQLICSAAFIALIAQGLPALAATTAPKADTQYLVVPVNRSSLVSVPSPMAEVMVANPDIADVHAHNSTHLTVVAKRIGRTNVRVFDKSGALLREFEVTVGHDLPAMRRALKNFLPDEKIGVEMVNTTIALTGQVTSAESSQRAERIVTDFIKSDEDKTVVQSVDKKDEPLVLNLLKITAGQQVMLRVRVGEINREALKNLGIDLNVALDGTGANLFALGTGGGIASLVAPATTTEPTINPGQFLLPGGRSPTNTRGIAALRYQPDGVNGDSVAGLVKALERDGLFKLLAEPNLIAISGEEAEFLAGGEIPIPVVQGTASTNNVTIEYKPFGVAVRFTPFVLSENRIRMQVAPEVSEISTENAVQISGFSIPSISTRRAKTTVELAPGESFMIAGLIKDQMRATIDQLPGAKELPVLGALFRSSEFRRNETELVIAVTPYVVDPLKGSDVRLPTDDFRPASQMEMFFYGALGSLKGRPANAQPGIEGPVGFMVD
jgi:pilus assembly protein CpaC